MEQEETLYFSKVVELKGKILQSTSDEYELLFMIYLENKYVFKYIIVFNILKVIFNWFDLF